MDNTLLSGSYSSKDVIFLLEEISGLITEQSNEFREDAIQNGIHYSEMLPIEYHPSEEYMKIFYETLEKTKNKLAQLVALLCNKIVFNRGKNLVLVSLARAGTPIGILIKRYMEYNFKIDLPHYSISIIRDKGIDENALNYILKEHPDANLQFIDGWTGKGVILDTLIKACKKFNENNNTNLDSTLAVLSDPAHCTGMYATREDFLIPSACLNSTVSGLMSRTVCNNNILPQDAYHGAKYYKEWESIDVSNYFLDTVCKEFENTPTTYSPGELKCVTSDITHPYRGVTNIASIQAEFSIKDINLVKPGVGETTRVLLRRIPWKILIDSMDNPSLKHIIKLALDKNIPIEVYPNMTYSCCGIIRPLEFSDL